MTAEEIDTHEKRAKQMSDLNKQIKTQLESIDPYVRSIEVLDTDYEDFLVLYSCYHNSDAYNSKG